MYKGLILKVKLDYVLEIELRYSYIALITVFLLRLKITEFPPLIVAFSLLFADGCENKKCDHYAECESDSGGEANCVCPKSCENVVSVTNYLNFLLSMYITFTSYTIFQN